MRKFQSGYHKPIIYLFLHSHQSIDCDVLLKTIVIKNLSFASTLNIKNYLNEFHLAIPPMASVAAQVEASVIAFAVAAVVQAQEWWAPRGPRYVVVHMLVPVGALVWLLLLQRLDLTGRGMQLVAEDYLVVNMLVVVLALCWTQGSQQCETTVTVESAPVDTVAVGTVEDIAEEPGRADNTHVVVAASAVHHHRDLYLELQIQLQCRGF